MWDHPSVSYVFNVLCGRAGQVLTDLVPHGKSVQGEAKGAN
jgi:hypothetical protein